MEQQVIEGAYLSGFEPSGEDLTAGLLFVEAQEYLFSSLTK